MISIKQKNKLFSMKLIKATALTVSCMVSLPSFSQSYECVTGYITGHDSSGQPIYSNTYCYPTGGSGGTSTVPFPIGIQGSGADTDDDGGYPPPPPPPDAQACLDLYAIKDQECLFDPVGKNEYNWNPFGSAFSDLFDPWGLAFSGLPSGGIPDFGAPIQVYQNIIRAVSQAYWDNQSLDAVNAAYWGAVDVFCIGFPEETTFGADRSDCYDDAYSVSLRLIPSFSDNAFTISQVEAHGVTIQHLSSGNPFANWAAKFFGDINKVKECKIWFDAKDQIPGCE